MIRLLPLEVQSCLRSGIATPSIAQCVEELVLNSVDAGATCVAVRVDVPNFKIQVVDNGKGLSEEELALVGRRYATSKCHKLADLEHLEYFGYRGEALASIVDIARVLEIVSRANESDVTMSKLFQSGKSEVFEASRKRPSVGTTVTVHGVFYNMPVRRKMISHTLGYERVCRRIEGLALIHPDISFSLRDDSSGTKSIQTHIASSTVATFRFLFGQSKAKCLKQVIHQECGVSISGHIGTDGHPNKSLQFIYVSNRLVLKTRLHKAINHLLRKSLIAHYRPRFGDKKSSADSTTVLELSNSPGRAADLYGIFVLNVRCPLSEYDICLEPSKTLVEFRDWSVVLGCVQKLVDQFLTQENLTMKQEKEHSESSQCDLLTLEDGSSQEDEEVSPSDKERMDTNLSSRLSQKYGRGINAASCSSTLQSLTVRRPLNKRKNNISTSTEVISLVSYSSSPEVARSSSEVTSPVCFGSSADVSSPVGVRISPTSLMVEARSSPLTGENNTSNQPRKVKQTSPTMISDVGSFESETEHPGRECNTNDKKLVDSIIQEPNIDLDGSVDKEKFTEQSEKQLNGQNEVYNQHLGGNKFHVKTVSHLSSREKGLLQEPVSDVEESSSKVFNASHSETSEKLTSELDYEKVYNMCAPVMDGPDISSSELHHVESQSSTPEQIGILFEVQGITDKNEKSLKVIVEEVTPDYGVAINSLESNISSEYCSYENDKVDEQSGDSTVTLQEHLRENISNSAITSDTRTLIDLVNCDQFTTPNVEIPDSLTYSGHSNQKESISDLSSFGLDTSSFDSDGVSNTSDSCVLIEKGEPPSVQTTKSSPGIAVKGSSPNSCEVYGTSLRDKAKCHLKTLRTSKPDDSRKQNHLKDGAFSSSSSRCQDSFRSSLQIFRRSFRAEHDGKEVVQHSISELLKGKDVEATRRFHLRNTGRQKQSSHFTTTSPVMLKRRFPPGDMMLGNNTSDEKSINDCLKKRQMSVPNKKNEPAESVLEPLKSTEMRNSKENCSPQTESEKISAKNTLDVHVSTENKGSNGEQHSRVTVTNKPNLKRLRQIHMASEKKSASEAIVDTFAPRKRQATTSTGTIALENLRQERTIGKRDAPLTKRFMTSDRFLQTFQRVFPTVGIKAKHLTSEQEISHEAQVPQGLHHIQHSPQATGIKFIATHLQAGPETSTNLSLQQAALNVQMPHSLVVTEQQETNKQCDEMSPITDAEQVCGLPPHTGQTGQKESPKLGKTHLNLKTNKCRIESQVQSEIGEEVKIVEDRIKEDSFQIQGESQRKVHELHDKEPERQTDLTYDDAVNEPFSQRLGTESMFCSQSSEEISQSLSRDEQHSQSVILCDTKTFKLRREQLSGLPTILRSFVPSDLNAYCSEPTEIEYIGCNINLDKDDPLSSEIETTKVSNLDLESRSYPFLLPNLQDLEATFTDNQHENTEDEVTLEVGRKCDPGFVPFLDTESLINSESLTEGGNMKTELFLLNQSQRDKDLHQASNPTLPDMHQVDSRQHGSSETSPTSRPTDFEINQLEHQQEATRDGSTEDSVDSQPAESATNLTVQSDYKLRHQEDLLLVNQTQHEDNLKKVSDTDCCDDQQTQQIPQGDSADSESTVDKRWLVQYDQKLKRQVYINLKTGNCSYENPVSRKDGLLGDGLADEGNGIEGNSVIIQTGRKKSYLHRVHSLCAEPFLATLPKPDNLIDESTSILSPSSHSALIHMVDEHMDRQGGDIASKWRGDGLSKQTDLGRTVDDLIANWTNPMFATVESGILDAQCSNIPHSSIRAQSTIHPYRFTKAMFQDIKVLGQVDNKFIACTINTNDKNKSAEPNLILLIDQHAAHERIRLEQLTADVFEDLASDEEDDDETTVEQRPLMKSSSVIPPISMTFSRKQLRLLGVFGKNLQRLGINYRIMDEDEDGEMEEGRIEITRLPSCLLEREAAELKRGRQSVAVSMVETLLMEHLELLHQTSGASAILPKTITRVLNSQACHGAVKFGDDLSYHECLSLIGQLSTCDLPFQCAHGRPSLVPLFDMKLLASKLQDEVAERKPRLKRLRAVSS
ncbi:uncharacterized protein LOC117294044 isoform X2 [Asterias rubens]|uniref:uncharacterized protein LOC117294044 isoform X2 n=1 Tax=Asterias rubens TaxID=7604 RepID=UPI001455A227|nr:uncharacterized protein LOC117294044 isoform X2 [Asterias rubens]